MRANGFCKSQLALFLSSSRKDGGVYLWPRLCAGCANTSIIWSWLSRRHSLIRPMKQKRTSEPSWAASEGCTTSGITTDRKMISLLIPTRDAKSQRHELEGLDLSRKMNHHPNQVNTKSALNPCTWKAGITYQPIGAGAFLYHSAFAEPWWYQRFTTQPQHKVLVFRGLGAEPSTSFLQNVLTLLVCSYYPEIRFVHAKPISIVKHIGKRLLAMINAVLPSASPWRLRACSLPVLWTRESGN